MEQGPSDSSDGDGWTPGNDAGPVVPYDGPLFCVFKGVGDALAGSVMGSVFGLGLLYPALAVLLPSSAQFCPCRSLRSMRYTDCSLLQAQAYTRRRVLRERFWRLAILQG